MLDKNTSNVNGSYQNRKYLFLSIPYHNNGKTSHQTCCRNYLKRMVRLHLRMEPALPQHTAEPSFPVYNYMT